jgi:hypothetical protein
MNSKGMENSNRRGMRAHCGPCLWAAGKKEARPKPGFLRPLTAGDSWGANLFGVSSVMKLAGACRADYLPTGTDETKGFAKRGDEFFHDVVLGVDARSSVRLTLVSLQTVSI